MIDLNVASLYSSPSRKHFSREVFPIAAEIVPAVSEVPLSLRLRLKRNTLALASSCAPLVLFAPNTKLSRVQITKDEK
jgi:hypothetical protein